MKELKKGLLLTSMVCMASMSYAQTEKEQRKPNEISGSVSLLTEFTDNAEKEASNEIDERQDRLNLNLQGHYENQYLSANLSYGAAENRFSDDSQSGRSTLEGESTVEFGDSNNLVSLLLSHSRKQLLNNPDDLDLLENTDERDILIAKPSIYWSMTGVDSFRLRADLSKVSYREKEGSDLTAVGATLSWVHALSAVDRFGLDLAFSDVEYDTASEFDYQYQNVSLFYASNLRRLQYQINVGYNETDSAGADNIGGLFYDLGIYYKAAPHDFVLELSQTITDSSRGNGNQELLPDLGRGSVSAESRGQLELTRGELKWLSTFICGRCTSNVSLGYQNEKFENDSDRDLTEQYYALNFSYKFTRKLNTSVNYKYSDKQFDSNIAESDYDLSRVKFSLNYRFNSTFSAGLYVSEEVRESNDAEHDYEEFVTGLSISAAF